MFTRLNKIYHEFPQRFWIVVGTSFIDGIGNGLGYGVILVIVSMIRELLGSGELMGFRIIPESAYELGYFNNGLIIMPPMDLIIVGIIVWIQRSRNSKLIEAK